MGNKVTHLAGIRNVNGWSESVATRIWRDEVLRLVRDEAAQLVEVLPPPEYEDEHIEGAISISLKNLDREADKLLDRDRPVIVY